MGKIVGLGASKKFDAESELKAKIKEIDKLTAETEKINKENDELKAKIKEITEKTAKKESNNQKSEK